MKKLKHTAIMVCLFACLLMVTQAGASQLIDLKKDAVRVPITVSVVGEGKNATRWQAIRKAQMLLAQELPSVVRYSTKIRNNDVQMLIHETLAQTVSMQVDSMKIEVFQLGEARKPEYRGASHNRFDINLDDGENPLGTLYRAKATITFLVLPAVLVERARLFEENKQLAKELNKNSQGAETAQGHYRNNTLLLERLNKATQDNPKLLALDDEVRTHKDTKNFTAGFEALAKASEGAGKLDIKRLTQARREGDLSFYRDREQNLAEEITAAHLDRKQKLDGFIKSLPAAFANSMKVVSATLEQPEPAYKIENGKLIEVSSIGTFGLDLFFNEFTLARFYSSYSEAAEPYYAPLTTILRADVNFKKAEPYYPPVTNILNIEIDTTCKLGEKRTSARLNLCELWETLPVALRNKIEIDGLYAGDQEFKGETFRHYLMGGDIFSREVLRMPTARYSRDKLLAEKPTHSRAMPYILYADDTPPARVGLRIKHEKWTNETAPYHYGIKSPVAPDLLAAGFVDRPPVLLTVLFAATKEYMDIPLTSNRYLLRNSLISVVMQDIKPNPDRDRLRAQDVRAVVWWSGDKGEVKHPAGSDWKPVEGELHYANLPSTASEGSIVSQMQWVRQYNKEIENNLEAVSEPLAFMYSSASCTGWFKQATHHPKNQSSCKNRLILQYGRKPEFNSFGVKELPMLPYNKHNNPMINSDKCYTLHPENGNTVACSQYFKEMSYPPRKAAISPLMKLRGEDLKNAIENNSVTKDTSAQLRKYGFPHAKTNFFDVMTGEVKQW